MSKKQKTDNRLKKLFKDIRPEQEDVSKLRSKPKVREEAPAPPPELKAVLQKPEPVSAPRPATKLSMARSIRPETITGMEAESDKSVYALNFQTGAQDWSTLRLLDETQKRQLTADEQLLIKQVTDQLSLAMENAALFQETKKRAEETAVLNDLSRSLASRLTLEQVVSEVQNGITRLLNAKNFYIAFYDRELNEITFPKNITESALDHSIVRLPLEDGITAQIIRTGESILINDGTDKWMMERGLKSAGEPAKSFLGIPILHDDQVIGAMALQDYANYDAYTMHDMELLQAFSNQASIAIQNAKLFEETSSRQKAQERSEADLRALFSSMEDVVLVVDSDGRYVRIAPTNPSRLLRAPNELLGQLMRDVVPDKETANQFEEAITKTLKTNETVQIEYKLPIGADTYWFLANLSKLDANNVFWVARDITERKKSEEELRKSQEQYALAAQAANDGLWDWDIITNEIYYSPRWKSMLGFEEHELTGGFSDWENLIHPDDHDYAVTALDNYLAGKADAYDVEIRLHHKDGSWRWVRDRGKALRDENGKAFRMAGSHSDVTDRRVADESVRRRNEYLAVSSEIGKIVTSTLDLNSIFIRTVNLIHERFGFYHASIFIVEETGFNAVLRESSSKAGAEMKKNKHSLQVNEKSIVGKVALEGNAIVVNDVTADSLHKFNPLLPETRAEAAIPLGIGNRIIGVIDIQAKNAGAFTNDEIIVLQTLADQVAVAIDNARSFELSQQAVKEMREIDRLKSQFLANMSHELRTPLNSIIGFSRVILKGIDGPVSELQQQDLGAIYNSGQHLLGLINDILDLAKIEAGKMELAFDEVNIADVANSVLSTMSGLIKDRPIQMNRVIEPDLPTVRGDAIRIRQVLINLLSNAAKFTDEGNITVEIGLKPGQTGRNEINVSVTDTGPGISIQDQEKLFQPFSQVDDSPTRKTGGTGLGLSICQQLINMHGGRIWVESVVGQGSTFHFTLPLFRKKREGNTLSTGSRMILSIDDDPQVIALYERYLAPQGYQVVPLTDPSRAVERVRQLRPFAVTLDIMMPGIDGWSILDSLKGNPDTRNIPVIVCSIIDDLNKGFNLGASDYLVKPILEDDLVNSLDRLNVDGSIREVLVIDDNPDDLRLIGKILGQDGRYKAILVEGGQKGWSLISSGKPPHAIILDLFMPELNGFQILENLQADKKLRDIPTIVISGMEITEEQKDQLKDFGQRLLTKGAFSEKELLTSIQKALERIQTNK